MANPTIDAVEIVIVPPAASARFAGTDTENIRRVVREHLLAPSRETYRKVQVEIESGTDGTPVALVASMLCADSYRADVVRVKLDAGYRVRSVERLS